MCPEDLVLISPLHLALDRLVRHVGRGGGPPGVHWPLAVATNLSGKLSACSCPRAHTHAFRHATACPLSEQSFAHREYGSVV